MIQYLTAHSIYLCATVNSQCLEYLGYITLVTKIWHQITITAVHGRGVGAVKFVETKESSCLGFVLHILFENEYHKMLIISKRIFWRAGTILDCNTYYFRYCIMYSKSYLTSYEQCLESLLF